MSIQCFWAAPNNRAVLFLRRYKSPSAGVYTCEGGWHDAQTHIGEGACELREKQFGSSMHKTWHPVDFSDNDGAWPARDDARWPKTCKCGYIFADADTWQFGWNPLYAGSPDGVPRSLQELPVGAMWRSEWYEDWDNLPAFTGTANPTGAMFRYGPEGWIVAVNTPDGEWCIDQKSKQGTFWSRDSLPTDIKPGDLVKITANPSILQPRYHGWLRNGVLVPA